jgi:hypothetical protein
MTVPSLMFHSMISGKEVKENKMIFLFRKFGNLSSICYLLTEFNENLPGILFDQNSP